VHPVASARPSNEPLRAALRHASVRASGQNALVASRDAFAEVGVTVESLLVFLIIGAVAGWLAGVIVKGHGFGLLGNIVVGIVGAFIAGWLLPGLGLGLTGILGSIVYALIGAVILLVIIGFIKRAT
jgi:uncharacterized membrane protein YeaQ/YmgE (transglycosylase-associated protein family)